jgi:hypothetical protein
VPKTPEKLQEVFDKHVSYEIGRLAEMYALLAEPDAFRFNSLDEAVRDTMKDALIVSFCIHAKNLMEFLSRSPEDHHAASADYADVGYEPWNIGHRTPAHKLRGKLNNQLSHLTFERTDDPNEKIAGPAAVADAADGRAGDPQAHL